MGLRDGWSVHLLLWLQVLVAARYPRRPWCTKPKFLKRLKGPATGLEWRLDGTPRLFLGEKCASSFPRHTYSTDLCDARKPNSSADRDNCVRTGNSTAARSE